MNETDHVQQGTVAGLVLAAGFSSRMGAFKPLLPLDNRTVIENAVLSFRQSGIADVIVVIGHRAEEMVPLVLDLEATPVFNPDYATGMYSSVKTGIQAIPLACDGCLLLPVDIPLVRAPTVEALLRHFSGSHAPILYPVFQGRRGHPPLISRHLFAEILEGDGTGGLSAVLARHATEALRVPVYDEGIHRDMDTPEDYAALCQMARRKGIPSRAECEAILADMQPNRDVIAHVRRVTEVADALAARLIETGTPLNADLIRAGSLLHDIAKGQADHATVGALQLERLGFPQLAPLVANHSNLDFSAHGLDESAVIFLADKLVRGTTLVSVEERFRRTFQRLQSDQPGLAAAKERHGTAISIVQATERSTGKTISQILAPIERQTVEPRHGLRVRSAQQQRHPLGA